MFYKSLFASSILCACSALFLTACDKTDTSANNINTPSETTSPASDTAPVEQLLVATDAGLPPFELLDENGVVIGFDVDVLKAIGKDQGFDVTFINQPRSQLFDSLASGKQQIAAACLGINPERLEKSEMSNPYVSAPNVIMTKDDLSPKTLKDLEGLTVAVQEGSYSATSLQGIAVKELKAEKTLFNAFRDFASGKVQAVVGDAGALSYWAKQNPELKVHTAIYDTTEDVRVGFAVKKGNTELINRINQGLANIRADGTYDKIYQTWFGDNNTLKVNP